MILPLWSASAAEAGLNVWTPLGPKASRVSAIAVDPVDPATAYAAIGGGTLKTTDAGTTWQPMSIGGITAFAIDPQHPEIVYAARDFEREGLVYRSEDRGATWSEPVLEETTGIGGIAIDRHRPALVYATVRFLGIAISSDRGRSWTRRQLDFEVDGPIVVDADGSVYVASGRTIRKSTDQGGTWTVVARFPRWQSFHALVSDQGSPEVLYAGGEEGFYRSIDAGDTWESIGEGLPDLWILSLAAHPGRTIYAGTTLGVFKSTNAGFDWQPTAFGPYRVRDVAVAAADPERIYAALGTIDISLSHDGGETWARANVANGSLFAKVFVDPFDPTKLYAAFEGLFQSSDSGRTWELRSDGLRDSLVGALEFDPRSPDTLYAGTCSGVFRSTDGALSWHPTGFTYDTSAHPSFGCVSSIAVDPADPMAIYAARAGSGVFKSADGAQTWSARNAGLVNEYVDTLAVDPRQPATLYAASSYLTELFGCGLYRSTDGAGNWQPICPPQARDCTALAVDPTNSALYAGFGSVSADEYGYGLFKSTDRGATWQKVDDPELYTRVSAIAVDRDRPSIVYASSTEGVHTSSDGGMRWRALAAGLDYYPGVTNFAVRPGAKRIVYAGSSHGLREIEIDGRCHGDCGRDGAVAIDELILGVAIARDSAQLDACRTFDGDSSGAIEIDELVAAVRDSVLGCAAAPAASYTAPRTFDVADFVESILVADFDGDGAEDVLTSNGWELSLLSGDGTGSFSEGRRISSDVSIGLMATADLDGDRIADLVVDVDPEPDRRGDILVLLGDREGSFSARARYQIGSFERVSLALGDLDGDAGADLVLGDDAGGVFVSLGRGDGSFGTFVRSDGIGCSSEGDCASVVGIADIDVDGAADVLETRGVLFGRGDGSFSPAVGPAWASTVADFDGDGALDLVRPGFNDHVEVRYGERDGSLSGPFFFGTPRYSFAAEIADLNRDGAPDIVSAHRDPHQVALLLNTGIGTFVAPETLPFDRFPLALVVADVDRNSIPDIVTAGACLGDCTGRASDGVTVWLGVD